MRPRTRRLLTRLHRWTGLLLGLWIVLQAVTGTAIVFREQANQLFSPSLMIGGAGDVGPSAALAAIARAVPDAVVNRLDFPRAPGGVYGAWFVPADGSIIHIATVDPADGRFLGTASLWSVPGELMFRIHYTLLFGDDGRMVIGGLGLLFLLLLVSGPFLWWQGWQRFTASLKIRLDAGRGRALLDLHRVVGVVACVVLIPVVTAGVLTAWKPQLQAVLQLAPVAVPAVKLRSDTAFLPPDPLVRIAEALQPGMQVYSLRFPVGKQVALAVLAEPGGGNARLWMDRYDGRVIAGYTPATAPASVTVPETILWIHKGEVLGLPGELLLFATGLTPPMLFVTGFWMWRRRSRAQAAARARAGALAERV